MADDLPLLSDQPGPDYVPYTTSRTVPGQAPVTTTGYGLRARPPLQPPSQGVPGIPDVSGMMRSAFEQLPVDEAIRVTNAVQQSMGQRLFAKAVQSGTPIPQAWATYGRMMFAGQNPGSAGFTGPPQITPVQQQELQLRRAAEGRAAQQTLLANAFRERELRVREAGLKKPTTSVTEEYDQPKIEGQEASPAHRAKFFGVPMPWTIPAQPAIKPQPARKIRKTVKVADSETPEETPVTPPEGTPVAPTVAAPAVPKRVRVKDKDGRIGTIPEAQLESALASGYSEVK